jgi:hypothetical protein
MNNANEPAYRMPAARQEALKRWQPVAVARSREMDFTLSLGAEIHRRMIANVREKLS